MRRLTKGKFAQTIATLLISIFGGPILMGWMFAVPASAQLFTTTELKTVAVVPFETLRDRLPESLAEKAALAVEQGLLDTGKYDVRQVSETTVKMKDLGIRRPLNEADFERLAQALGVDGIIFGEVRGAGTRQLTRTVQGEVTVMLGLYDVPSRTVMSGAISTGTSKAKAGEVDRETLVEEALNQAVFQAVEDLDSHRPITGAVQWAAKGDTTINVGQPEGVLPTMKFVVLHEGRRTGIIKIARVERSYSFGRVIEGRAQTSDVVREIVEIPADSKEIPEVGAKERKNRGLRKLLYGVLGAFLLYSLLNNSSGGQSKTAGFKVAAISNLVDLSGLDTSWVSSFQPNYDDPISGGSSPGGAVQLKWKGLTGTSSDLVAGYEIYRNGLPYWFVPAQGSGTTLTTPQYSSLLVDITIPENSSVPQVTASLPGVIEAPTPPPICESSGWETDSVSLIYSGDLWLNNSGDVDILTYIGATSGTRVLYQVKRIVSKPSGSTIEDPNYIVTREAAVTSQLSVTFVAPPRLVLPAYGEPIADASAIDFGFNASAGADDYIMQISKDSQFAPSATVTDTLTIADGVQDPFQLIFITLDVESKFGGPLPSGTRLYWRVGARWRGDKINPLPYPMGEVPTDIYRFVFSKPGHIDIQ